MMTRAHRPKCFGLCVVMAVCPGCLSFDDGFAPLDGGAEETTDAASADHANAVEAATSERVDAALEDALDDALDDAVDDVRLDVVNEIEVGDEPTVDEEDAGPCPLDMVHVGDSCIDRYEAPNRAGALPLVMFHFVEAESWCVARGKRLCFDDEWTRACGGDGGRAYPYGDKHVAGVCTDDKTWKTFDQKALNGWPWTLATDDVEDLDELLMLVRQKGSAATAAADHVWWLYQAEPSGSREGCVGGEGAFDLTGNVEEWTRRRVGGSSGFRGALKGRYWAESRTCQQSVTVHGDTFRFYEIGFRCCRDVPIAEAPACPFSR